MLLYLRIFTVNRRMRLFTYLGITFQALYYNAFIGIGIGAVVECNGPSQLTHQLCANFRPLVVLNVTINAVTDIYVLLLPVPCVLKLQLSKRHRLGLLLVFACGVVYAVNLSLLDSQANVKPQDLYSQFDSISCRLRPL